ncbi:MAG TPA: response regulator transcription factor, partial [Verrucomicrobiae bacterium]|nr:response regulator transcription factor [Verrucomicrobiae bacterium]
MDRINVIIAENESSEREKLKGQLAGEPDFQIVGEARDGKECVELVTRHRPDVVLIKEDLPVLNGLAAAEQITSELPEVGVILILTGSEGQEVWHKMLRAGIKEFVTRPLVTERLVEEVRKVATLQAKAAKFAGVAAAAPAVAAEGPKRQVVTVTGPRGGC